MFDSRYVLKVELSGFAGGADGFGRREGESR